MSRSSFAARKLAVASLASLTLFGAGASAAHASTLSLTESCKFPLIGAVPVAATIQADIPGSWPALQPTDAFPVTATVTIPAAKVSGIAASLEGAIDVGATIVAPDGTETAVNLTRQLNPVLKPLSGDPLSLTVTGFVPSFPVPLGGDYQIKVTSLSLLLRGRDFDGQPVVLPPAPGTIESDADRTTFDVGCAAAPVTQNALLGGFTVLGPEPAGITSLAPANGPAAGGNEVKITGTGFSRTTTVTFDSVPAAAVVQGSKLIVATAPAGVAGSKVAVRVVNGGVSSLSAIYTYDPAAPGPLKPSIASLSPTHGLANGGNEVALGLSYNTSPITSVKFGATAAPIVSQTTTMVVVKAPAGFSYNTVDVIATNAVGMSANTAADDYTYDPVTEAPIDYPYTLAGSATLKTLVQGSVPLTGSILARLTLPDGGFYGDLKLNQADAKLTALGFLPVTAKLAIVPTAPVTGFLVKGVLNANAKVRIKLPSVSLFGLQLGGGATCQTKSLSSINLKSTEPFFYPTKGGPIAGTFSISDLTGCGALTGVLSSLTKSSGNAIVLNLTPVLDPPATT